MADDEDKKQDRLKVIGGDAEPEDEVIRLERRLDSERSRPMANPQGEIMIQAPPLVPADPEEEWSPESSGSRTPYGWFVLIFLVLGGVVAWSVVFLGHPGGLRAEEKREQAINELAKERLVRRSAVELVEETESVLERYLAASSLDDLLPLVRDPQRVLPLMRDWYANHPFEPREFGAMKVFQPLTLEGRAFWLVTALADDEEAVFILEQTDEDEMKVDWESQVCYQPMSWDLYARQRPEDTMMDFRVYLEPDPAGLFSHEFADEEEWDCYRLTARDSMEFLFGYVGKDSPLADQLRGLVEANQGGKTSLLLRLSLRKGTESPRGVVIDQVVSERWAVIKERKGAGGAP